MSRIAIIDRVKIHFIVLIIVFLGVFLPSASVRANDTFPGTTITGSSGSFVGSNTAATAQTGEPLIAGGGPQRSMWYSWVAPASGVVNIGTCNSGNLNTTLDSMVGVYTGTTVTSLTTLASNDDTTGCSSTAGANYGSTVSFTAVSGTTYRFLVDGYATTTPTGTFNFYFGFVALNVATTVNSTTEGGDTAEFTVALTTVPTANVTVSIGTSSQCTFSGPLTFTPSNWNTPQTVTVTAIDDFVTEAVTTCSPASVSAAGGGFAGVTATPPTFTVNDNDGQIAISVTDNTAAEAGGNTGAFRVVLTTAPTANVTVTISTSTQCTFASSSLTFTTANWATGQTVTATAINDLIVEGLHSCSPASITGNGGGYVNVPGAPPTIFITDNDAATVTLANTTQGNETGPVSGVMTLTQTAVSATNTVLAYSIAGTATSALDYSALSGTVTILAGATTATISIPVIDDAIVEPAETVIVTLTSVTSGLATLGATVAATNTITNNDTSTASIANTTNGQESGPTNGVMTVTLTKASSTNTVISYSIGGTATAGTDYVALTGSVTVIAGNTTATITLNINDDATIDPNETVIVTLTAITSGQPTLGSPLAATNTIIDNDLTVTIANTTNGSEAGPTTGVITVSQTAITATNTVISYSVSGTATSGVDYSALSGTVTILAGATNATIIITVTNDLILDPAETVIVTLTAITSGTPILGSPLVATNTIADNDSATVSIANTTNGAEAVAPTNGLMTITQTAVSATNTVLTYTVSGSAAAGSDYTTLSGSVTIFAGSTTATISIPVLDDLVVETNETVIVTLTAISGLPTLGTPLVATNTISDNDVAAFTIAKAVNLSAIAVPGTLNYTINIASAGNVPLTVPVLTDALSNGSALTLTSGPTLTSGDAAPLGVLNAGETWIYTATYAVTQANINNGAAITNSATFDTAETSPSTSNTASTTITQNPHLTITKTASTNGPVPVGTVITYTYQIANDGNITMTAVKVVDTHNGSGPLVGPSNEVLTDVAPTFDSPDASLTGPPDGIWDTLAPGDTVKFTATYAATQHDVDYLQ